ncbi:hypothetical protein SUGI_0801150 [Cryptomeria japonica]|nr:hypothetical protein SUGI_0801150 [Cryptomeria japonica]
MTGPIPFQDIRFWNTEGCYYFRFCRHGSAEFHDPTSDRQTITANHKSSLTDNKASNNYRYGWRLYQSQMLSHLAIAGHQIVIRPITMEWAFKYRFCTADTQ